MKKNIKLFSKLQQTELSMSVSIKCRKIALHSKVFVSSIQPCFMEINSKSFLCASKLPNKSEDNCLKELGDFFKHQSNIDADKFKELWGLACDNYSRLEINTPDPIDIQNYINPPALCIRVEYFYRKPNPWKSYYREWNSNNYITKRQIDEATQFYKSLQPSFDSNLRIVNFLILISYIYKISHPSFSSFYRPKLTRPQIRMLEIWGEQKGETISRGVGVNAASKKDRGRLSSSLYALANSGKGIEKLTEGKFQEATWRLDGETYHAYYPEDKLLSPSAIKACKERAHEFKRMKLF